MTHLVAHCVLECLDPSFIMLLCVGGLSISNLVYVLQSHRPYILGTARTKCKHLNLLCPLTLVNVFVK